MPVYPSPYAVLSQGETIVPLRELQKHLDSIKAKARIAAGGQGQVSVAVSAEMADPPTTSEVYELPVKYTYTIVIDVSRKQR